MILSSPHCSLLHIFSEDFFFFKQPHLGQQLTKVYEILFLCIRSSFPQQQITKTILRNVLLHLKIKSKSLFYTNITSYVPHLLLSPCFYWCSFQTNFSKHLLSLPFTHLIFPSASLSFCFFWDFLFAIQSLRLSPPQFACKPSRYDARGQNRRQPVVWSGQLRWRTLHKAT